MLLNPFTFHAPESLPEAVDLYTKLESVRLQAGGTFLINSLKSLKKKGAKTPEHVISLRKIKELKGISDQGDRLAIRAMTTIGELLDSPLLTGSLSVLKTAAGNIATTPVRNMATVGGNLTCRYTWTEMPAAMVGLDAEMHFTGAGGREEIIRAEDFFKAAAKTDKIFTHVTIRKDPSAVAVYRRVKKSPCVDIPLLSLIIKTNFSGGRFTDTRAGINNGIDFARRDCKLENFLNQSGRPESAAREAAGHLDDPIYDTRGSDYKKHMFRVSIKDAVTELVKNAAH